jgi:hypothetical protein
LAENGEAPRGDGGDDSDERSNLPGRRNPNLGLTGLAVSGTGNSQAFVAVSATGHASGAVAVSGCDTLSGLGRNEACVDTA